jgi:GAF domain-containing protein
VHGFPIDATGAPLVVMWRSEPDGRATVVGVWAEEAHPFQLGASRPLAELPAGPAAAPIVVDGAVWGVLSAHARGGAPLPEPIPDRLAALAEVVATAISSSERGAARRRAGGAAASGDARRGGRAAE